MRGTLYPLVYPLRNGCFGLSNKSMIKANFPFQSDVFPIYYDSIYFPLRWRDLFTTVPISLHGSGETSAQ